MKILLSINNTHYEADVKPVTPLLDVLRDSIGLTGTKYGCGEGECGACTVLVDGEPVMSCLLPVCQAEGCEIETIEGLASVDPDGGLIPHPLQQAFLEEGGAQCGICTPGMIMAALAWLRDPSRAPGGVREALEGNLCRCTGYAAIFRSVEKARIKMEGVL